jgi:hypothetical protein
VDAADRRIAGDPASPAEASERRRGATVATRRAPGALADMTGPTDAPLAVDVVVRPADHRDTRATHRGRPAGVAEPSAAPGGEPAAYARERCCSGSS